MKKILFNLLLALGFLKPLQGIALAIHETSIEGSQIMASECKETCGEISGHGVKGDKK